jgi:hypothetical protein
VIILDILGAFLLLVTFYLALHNPKATAFGVVTLIGMALLGYGMTYAQLAAGSVAVWLGAFSEALVGKD